MLLSTKVEGKYWKHGCNRCAYIWYSTNSNPNRCPQPDGCNSPYWNKDRVKLK